MRFKDKVVVITGGAAGIGLATARRFAQEGAVVAICDVRAEAAQQAAQSLTKAGGTAIAFAGDVSNLEHVRQNAKDIIAQCGRIDILVNNAGTTFSAPAEELDPQSWRRTLEINLFGSFYWAQAAATQSMIANRGGVIVNVSSLAGLAAVPGNIAYVSSKHGLIGLTKSLAVEWGKFGIRVNCLCPGLTETELVSAEMAKHPAQFAQRRKRVPLGRTAEPIEQANVILFMASAEASYLHGNIMNVDGGQLALHAGYPTND
jgi:NAD(P)-dependent dehydrogenase (short-subunit alcohol dehydrogenase family)